MKEAEFNRRVDELMLSLEEALDDCGADLDYESAGSLLTISCESNGSQVIVSRQPALMEIWVAARSGGYHLGLDGENWRCATTGETFKQLLERTLGEQSGEAVCLDF